MRMRASRSLGYLLDLHALKPFFGAEDDDGGKGDAEHDANMYPKGIRAIGKGNARAHGEHI